MLNKEEELGCLEILKNNFPDLKNQGLVVGLYEFLSPNLNLSDFISFEKPIKEMVLPYIHSQKPYIILDESEGYKCIFFKGMHIRAQYDVTNSKMISFIE